MFIKEALKYTAEATGDFTVSAGIFDQVKLMK